MLAGLSDGNYTLEVMWDAEGDDTGGCSDLRIDHGFTASLQLTTPGSAIFTNCGDAMGYDGHDYATVQIGQQCWFQANLQTEHYANGDAIPTGLSNAEWNDTNAGAQAVHGDNDSNLPTYGRLYNWYAGADARGLCPSGWHVPSDDNFKELETHLGMPADELDLQGYRGADENIGGQMKEAGTAHWSSPNTGATNSSGLTVVPGSYRNCCSGIYGSLTFSSSLWTSSSESGAGLRRQFSRDYASINRQTRNLGHGFAVRCMLSEEGCTNSGACNYDSAANLDDGSCILPASCDSCSGETDGTGTLIDGDADDDGTCDADEIVGCQDAAACNYNSAATDSGACESATGCDSCSGETDGTGTVVDGDADDDGVCDADEVAGCTDMVACNYDVTATDDDGSCESLSCAGCTDMDACNYDAGATIDDTSCVLPDGDCDTCSGETDGTGTVVDGDTNDNGTCDAVETCPLPSAYKWGCIDTEACNYDSDATDDDGSCLYGSACDD